MSAPAPGPAASPTTPAGKEAIRILAAATPNPASLKFTVDRPLLEGRTAQFHTAAEAAESSLGRRLFALGGITEHVGHQQQLGALQGRYDG